MSEDKATTECVNLKRLYDYTKFHAGLYGGLIFGVVALIQFGGDKVSISEPVIKFASYAVFCWFIAGFAGGVILGNLVEYNCSLDDFRKKCIGPFGWEWMPCRFWEAIEHLIFWLGVVLALFAFNERIQVILNI